MDHQLTHGLASASIEHFAGKRGHHFGDQVIPKFREAAAQEIRSLWVQDGPRPVFLRCNLPPGGLLMLLDAWPATAPEV
jgi:hypothetical protein